MGKEGQKTLVENLDQVVSTEGTVLHSSENRLSHCCRIRTAGIRTAVAFALLAFALLTLSHCWHSHCWLRTGVVRTVVFRTLVGIPQGVLRYRKGPQMEEWAPPLGRDRQCWATPGVLRAHAGTCQQMDLFVPYCGEHRRVAETPGGGDTKYHHTVADWSPFTRRHDAIASRPSCTTWWPRDQGPVGKRCRTASNVAGGYKTSCATAPWAARWRLPSMSSGSSGWATHGNRPCQEAESRIRAR